MHYDGRNLERKQSRKNCRVNINGKSAVLFPYYYNTCWFILHAPPLPSAPKLFFHHSAHSNEKHAERSSIFWLLFFLAWVSGQLLLHIALPNEKQSRTFSAKWGVNVQFKFFHCLVKRFYLPCHLQPIEFERGEALNSNVIFLLKFKHLPTKKRILAIHYIMLGPNLYC